MEHGLHARPIRARKVIRNCFGFVSVLREGLKTLTTYRFSQHDRTVTPVLKNNSSSERSGSPPALTHFLTRDIFVISFPSSQL